MRYRDIKSGRVDLSVRAVERGGWLSALPRDPAADPPDFPRYPRTRLPVRREDFAPRSTR